MAAITGPRLLLSEVDDMMRFPFAQEQRVKKPFWPFTPALPSGASWLFT
jgi:hypothetical protein